MQARASFDHKLSNREKLKATIESLKSLLIKVAKENVRILERCGHNFNGIITLARCFSSSSSYASRAWFLARLS